jgi:hypothetical protein
MNNTFILFKIFKYQFKIEGKNKIKSESFCVLDKGK